MNPLIKSLTYLLWETYRGKPSGVKFNNDFIDWIENFSMEPIPEQTSFDFE